MTSMFYCFAGVRAVDVDGDAGDAAGGERDRPRVHVRHAKTPTDDHLRRRKGADPNLSELAGSSAEHRIVGSTDVRVRLRRNGAHVQRG